MFTVFMIDGEPDKIYFVRTEYLGRVLLARDLDGSMIKFQELNLETLVRLNKGDCEVFILCLK